MELNEYGFNDFVNRSGWKIKDREKEWILKLKRKNI